MQDTQEMLIQSLSQEDPFEKEIAAHSSMLAWKIPWTEESGWLQFMGLQRLGHDGACMHAYNFSKLMHTFFGRTPVFLN